MSRDYTVAFRVSREELDLLHSAAAADRRILSDYLRLVCLDAAVSRANRAEQRTIFDGEAQ